MPAANYGHTMSRNPNLLVPVTILTGFLGSGKTTLLNRILKEQHGQRIAVIENEFGEEGVDNDLLLQNEQENIVEMNNGCLCCTVRGDLVRIMGQLYARKKAGELNFERVVIETTGMADPGPVAQTFFVDDEVAENYLLDAVITVVDAKHAMQQLDENRFVQRRGNCSDQGPSGADQPKGRHVPVGIRQRAHRQTAGHPRLQPEFSARHRTRLP